MVAFQGLSDDQNSRKMMDGWREGERERISTGGGGVLRPFLILPGFIIKTLIC